VIDVSSRSETGTRGRSKTSRLRARVWLLSLLAAFILTGVWWYYSQSERGLDAQAMTTPPPEVVVSKPLQSDLDARLEFLGQFSAVDQVDVRPQVGGTLTGIYFKDGDIVRKGDLLFTIDSLPYEIRLAQANAQFETANARLVLANRELVRAQTLRRSLAGTEQNVDQRTADRGAAQAAVDNAKAQIRDAQFDLDHCRITAPFTGRIGNHLVSVGNLVAGSRAATSPTTLLATLVSLDPVHLDFDMSESDYEVFSRHRVARQGSLGNKVAIALNGENSFSREGILDFVNNVLDRSSGTIHARATVANPQIDLTPGAFARVRLTVAPPTPALLVPDAAIMPDQSRHVVLTVEQDSTVIAKQVEIADIRGGLRVVRSGLSASDRVIIDGLPYARQGSKVSFTEQAIHYAVAGQE